MAETGTTGDVLKQFVNKITTSSVNERLAILQLLHPHIERDDFPEAAQKGILKTLLLTLTRYRDAKSRRAVENVICILASKHFEVFHKLFNNLLGTIADSYRKGPPSRGYAAASLNALGWTCVLVRNGYKEVSSMQGDVFKRLVEIQALFMFGASMAGRTSITDGAYNRLKRLWLELPGCLECYVAALQKIEPSCYLLSMIGCIMKFLTATKKTECIKKYKDGFVDLYIKQVIGSRSKPAAQILRSSKELLRHLSHEHFKDLMLPAVEKAMLRNPEIIIEAVCEMLAGLSIDLSQYALDIGKHLATQCHSKEEEFREVAAKGCKHLAKQCSDSTAVEKLVKHLFGVLNGSEGKLTVLAQRLGMMSGIGNVSYNSVTGATTVQNVSSTVAEYFIPVLQLEVHEGFLVHTLNMFYPWCQKFTTEVPTKLVEWFKTGMGQKAATAPVRNAYIQCMNAAFQRDTLSQGISLLPVLLQSVEKAAAQPSQPQLVTEALSAACLLSRLSDADIKAEGKLANFWSIILDLEKQLFVNEKYLSAASDEALCTLAILVERLILEHPQKVSEKNLKPYYKGLLHTMIQKSYKVRKKKKVPTATLR